MARKKQSLLDEAVGAVAAMPWWLGLALSVGSYFFMRWLAIPDSTAPVHPKLSGEVVGSATGRGIARVGQVLLPLVFLIGAAISAFRQLSRPRIYVDREREPAWEGGRFPRNEETNSEEERDLYEIWKDVDESPSVPVSPPTDRWSLPLLKRLEWKRFEILCSIYFETLDFTSRRTHKGADGGIDIRLYPKGATTPGVLVQCKAWRDWKVGVAIVRELFGVMTAEKVAEGIVITTSTFSPDAVEFAKGKNIHLIDGDDLLAKLLALDEQRQRTILAHVTEGDYTTPTCPSCGDGVRMKLRISSRDGTRFWGCPSFPICRARMNYSSEASHR